MKKEKELKTTGRKYNVRTATQGGHNKIVTVSVGSRLLSKSL